MPSLMTLPAKNYVDPDYFARETEYFFFNQWICVGREQQIEKSGNYFLRTILKENLILTRDPEGKPRALFNVCRHRGTRLCESEEGNFKGRIACPYHAWTYSLSGELAGAPHMDERQDFCLKDYPLQQVACEAWDGNLFVNFSNHPKPLIQQIGGLGDKFKAWEPAKLRLAKRIRYQIKANWKLIIQNYSECLHCPVIHPALKKLTNYMSGDNEPFNENYLGGTMTLNDGIETMTFSGKSSRSHFPLLDSTQKRHVYYYWLNPNLLLSYHPDYLMTDIILPKGPDETEVICEFHFHPEEMKKSHFSGEDVVEFWDSVNKEDWHVSVLSQQGLQSRGYRPGPYSPREGLLWKLDSIFTKIPESTKS